MSVAKYTIIEVDPRGADAMSLLREAAIEARTLYQVAEGAPWPGNPPTPAGGIYLLAYAGALPVACGALRPLDADTAEVRRMYVLKPMRRGGLARTMLAALEQAALRMGYRRLRLETGNLQHAAMRLYEACGFAHIAPFGEYVGDPLSVCYEKRLRLPD